jgi:polyphenol oxidase
MTNWHWQTINGSPYLTCNLLQEWQHGFLTKHFSPLEPIDITQLFQPQARGYRLKQVHGNVVLTPPEAAQATDRDPESGWAMADGLISDGPQQGLWVASADCNPVLVADRQTGQVAAVHAGWRGTAQGIVTRTVQRFLAAGSQPEQLVVAIGPAIDGEVYQVSTQVGAEVCLPILPQIQDLAPAEIVQAVLALENSPLLPDAHPGRVRLDVRRANWFQLRQLGLAADQISIAPHCTFQEPENFFSYRREKLKRVQWSGIISRE